MLLQPLKDGPEHFLEEYAKLQRTLETAHEAENRWALTCKTLSKKMKDAAQRLTGLEQVMEVSSKKRAALEKQLEESKAAHEDAAKGINEKKQRLESLRTSMQQMQVTMKQAEEESIAQQRAQIQRLEADLMRLTQHKDKELFALTKSRGKSLELHAQLQDQRAIRRKGQSDLEELDRKIVDAQAWAGRETRRKTELERSFRELQSRVADRQQQITNKREAVSRARSEHSEAQGSLVRFESLVTKNRGQLEELTSTKNQTEELLRLAKSDAEEASRALARATHDRADVEERVAVGKQSCEAKLKLMNAISVKVSKAHFLDYQHIFLLLFITPFFSSPSFAFNFT